MANYPPPPPGGGWAPPPAGPAPYDADRALAEWAQARGYQLNPAPDLRWYQAWYPFAFLPHTSRVGREARATFGEASLCVTETYEGDLAKQAIGEDRHVMAFLMSPRLAYRAAVRSKQGGGILDDVSKGLNDLFGSNKKPQGLLGDPAFEARFEVMAPTPQEGVAALPPPLRQVLLATNFRGILEVRAQGMVVCFFDRTAFDPQTLDGTIGLVGQLYGAAVQYPHVVTAPPR